MSEAGSPPTLNVRLFQAATKGGNIHSPSGPGAALQRPDLSAGQEVGTCLMSPWCRRGTGGSGAFVKTSCLSVSI